MQILKKMLSLCSLLGLAVFVLPVHGASDSASSEWQKLMGEQIELALTSRTLAYGNSGTTQDFKPSGRTLYDAGKPSWGYWRVQGDQYCSQWPPQGLWVCYDLFASGNGREMKFVGESGDVSVGRYIDL